MAVLRAAVLRRRWLSLRSWQDVLRVSGEQVSASLRECHKTHGLGLHAPALFELHGRGQLLPACFAKQNGPLTKLLDELSLLLRSFPV